MMKAEIASEISKSLSHTDKTGMVRERAGAVVAGLAISLDAKGPAGSCMLSLILYGLASLWLELPV